MRSISFAQNLIYQKVELYTNTKHENNAKGIEYNIVLVMGIQPTQMDQHT